MKSVVAILAAVLLLAGCGGGVHTKSDTIPWAGYATIRVGVSEVTATWKQPRVLPRSNGSYGAGFWVGLVGEAHHTIEQIGTAGYSDGHSRAQYDVWYELYPARAVTTRLAVRPGDVVTATVVGLSRDRFRLRLSNATTGGSFETTKTVRGVGTTGAAIIVEPPDASQDIGFAGFDPVRFTNCAVNGASIDGFHLTSFDVTTADGQVETITSQVAANGRGFTVSCR